MECSAMSTAAIFTKNRACRGGVSAPGQGTVAKEKFAPAGTEPNIPLFPHFPRNGHPDPAGSGNVGKEGNVSAASRPVRINLGWGLTGLRAQIP